MAFSAAIINTRTDITILSDLDIDVQDPHFLGVMIAVAALNTLMPFETFTVKLLGNNTHTYELTTTNGRSWKQRLNTSTPVNLTSFNSTPVDFWTKQEAATVHGQLQEHVFALIRLFHLTDIDCVLTVT